MAKKSRFGFIIGIISFVAAASAALTAFFIIREKKKKDDGTEETVGEEKLKIVKRPELLNETQPLWTKTPSL